MTEVNESAKSKTKGLRSPKMTAYTIYLLFLLEEKAIASKLKER